MQNPIFVTCVKEVWTKVATAVTEGQLWKDSSAPALYLHTYRLTGAEAPTLRSEGVAIFLRSINEEIKASASIDIYIYTVAKTGRVRVDI